MEQKLGIGTKVRCIDTGEIFTICEMVQTNNQWGYGIFIYQFEETIKTRPAFGLYRREFTLI